MPSMEQSQNAAWCFQSFLDLPHDEALAVQKVGSVETIASQDYLNYSPASFKELLEEQQSMRL